ncbi:MAG: ABC transporter substrate-binding protein [Dehalococcoidia bacterium]
MVSDAEFDPHKTQSPPLAAYQSLLFSRLLTYESQAAGVIGADLALSLPEQPDPLEFIVRLNQSATWPDGGVLGGRTVTAEDVKFSIERQRDGDVTFVRRPQWLNIESIDAVSPDTVSIKTAEPRATTLHQLADVHSFIVAPESAEAGFGANQQPGSGPFLAVEWNERLFASAVANRRWFGGSERPYLDGISVEQPRDAVEVEASLRTKKLDVAFVDRPVADRLRTVIPELVEVPAGLADFFGMRFFLPESPYDDVRVRTALALSIDRREMIRTLFADSGEVNPWVSWPITRWSLPQAELSTMPGYRPGAAGRAEDIGEARALLDAYRADNELPESLDLLVVDEAERSLGLGSIIRDQVDRALTLKVNVVALPLTEIVTRLLNQQAPWVAGPDSGWIDLDDWLYPYFHSEGTKNSFAIRDEDLDSLIITQRTELDPARRQETGFEIQRRLLELNAGINFVSERVIALAWPYVRSFPLDATDGFQGRLADCWLDRSDSTFEGR